MDEFQQYEGRRYRVHMHTLFMFTSFLYPNWLKRKIFHLGVNSKCIFQSADKNNIRWNTSCVSVSTTTKHYWLADFCYYYYTTIDDVI
jgi:hypothetical protein